MGHDLALAQSNLSLGELGAGGGCRLVLQWEGAGITKQLIAPQYFYSLDSDADGLSDDWEIAKHGKLTTANGSEDSDSDGV